MDASRRSPLIGLVLVVLVSGGASQLWRAWNDGRNESTLGPEMAQRAVAGDIRMIASETCVYCKAAKLWFQRQNVPVTECLIERDPVCAADYRAAGAPGTPLLIVRGEQQLGFSPERVLQRLNSKS